MAIIIGVATTVLLGGGDICATSVNWSANPNNQRLYCLGKWDPHMTISKPTETLSISLYAPGPSHTLPVTIDCVDANTIEASVAAAPCGGSGSGGVSGSWFVNSYSYSKDDANLPGTESWSMQHWVGTTLPSFVLRGISDGQGTGDSGITFDGLTASSSTGSVSAGGIGRADTLEMGIVTGIGGGSSAAGDTGQGSVSIPYTDVYI